MFLPQRKYRIFPKHTVPVKIFRQSTSAAKNIELRLSRFAAETRASRLDAIR